MESDQLQRFTLLSFPPSAPSIHPLVHSDTVAALCRLSSLFLLLIHLPCLPLFLFLGHIVFRSSSRRRLTQSLSRPSPLWWRLLCNEESELRPLCCTLHFLLVSGRVKLLFALQQSHRKATRLLSSGTRSLRDQMMNHHSCLLL